VTVMDVSEATLDTGDTTITPSSSSLNVALLAGTSAAAAFVVLAVVVGLVLWWRRRPSRHVFKAADQTGLPIRSLSICLMQLTLTNFKNKSVNQ